MIPVLAMTAAERRTLRRNRLLLAGLTVIAAAGAVTPAARGLTYLFPVLCLGLALYFSGESRRHYVGLVCWLFFLTPLLRRLIEFRTGSATASFVMVSPFLACFAGLAVYRKHWSWLMRPELRSWLYVIAALGYGTVVGFLSNGLLGLIQDVFGWISPLSFAMYVFHER